MDARGVQSPCTCARNIRLPPRRKMSRPARLSNSRSTRRSRCCAHAGRMASKGLGTIVHEVRKSSTYGTPVRRLALPATRKQTRAVPWPRGHRGACAHTLDRRLPQPAGSMHFHVRVIPAALGFVDKLPNNGTDTVVFTRAVLRRGARRDCLGSQLKVLSPSSLNGTPQIVGIDRTHDLDFRRDLCQKFGVISLQLDSACGNHGNTPPEGVQISSKPQGSVHPSVSFRRKPVRNHEYRFHETRLCRRLNGTESEHAHGTVPWVVVHPLCVLRQRHPGTAPLCHLHS